MVAQFAHQFSGSHNLPIPFIAQAWIKRYNGPSYKMDKGYPVNAHWGYYAVQIPQSAAWADKYEVKKAPPSMPAQKTQEHVHHAEAANGDACYAVHPARGAIGNPVAQQVHPDGQK